MTCPCGRPADFEHCCGPFLAGAPPPTAEALMRARYSAYVRGDVDFIVRSHRAAPGEEVDRAAVDAWSREAEWLGLEVLATEAGGEADETGVVEFVARWRARGQEQRHHERSRFVRVDGRWMYADGKEIKPPPVRRADTPGRNDPCPCGSGKKFKRCHGSS